MTETEIIQLFYEEGKVSVLDDCAFLGGTTNGRLHTTDALVEGTHFHLSWSGPEHLARKLLQANVSDILSSGGVPHHAFLNLGLPRGFPDSFLVRFAAAFRRELSDCGVQLLGGDSFRAPVLFLGLHLIGDLSPACGKSPVERSGGSAGEWLYLTGDLGRSLLGYRLLSKFDAPPFDKNSIDETSPKEPSLQEAFPENADASMKRDISQEPYPETPLWKKQSHLFSNFELLAIERHLAPKARTDLIEEILKNYRPSAMIDISDGLVPDAGRLAKASGICLSVDVPSLPVKAETRKVLSLEDALVSGEEFELLFLSAVPPDTHSFPEIHCIGRAVEVSQTGQALRLLERGQEIPLPQGFRHW